MKKDTIHNVLIYIAALILGVLVVAMFTGCNNSKQTQGTEENIIEVYWDTDGDRVYVQYRSDSDWVTEPEFGVGRDMRRLKQKGVLYRIKVVKDADTSYSKMIYVR